MLHKVILGIGGDPSPHTLGSSVDASILGGSFAQSDRDLVKSQMPLTAGLRHICDLSGPPQQKAHSSLDRDESAKASEG